jgi:hypothetical protein
MKQGARTYLIEFGLSMAAYALLLPLSVLLIDESQPVFLRSLLAVLPVLPLVFAFRAYLRFVGSSDERQQRIQLQALAFAAGVAGLSTFTYGLLVENAGLPPLSLVWVFPLLIVLWGLASAVLNWRHR